MSNKKGKGMDVLKASIKSLLNGSHTFKVPNFQRAYVWKIDDWERFLEDMVKISEEDKDYFMGFIILKKIDSYSFSPSNLVVDGQQRLTTFLIFSKIMCEFDKENEEKISFEAENGDIIFHHNYSDRYIFELILSGDPISKEIKEIYDESNVLGCYNYFKDKKQKEMIAEVNLDKVLKHLFFVCMSLTPDDDEQQIFDTMNSLGVSLLLPELLKNKLFDANQEELYENTWRDTFEKDESIRKYWSGKAIKARQPRTNIELLLQSVLLVKEAEHTGKGYQNIGDLFKNYRDILDKHYSNENQREEFIKELMGYAKIYKDNIQPNVTDMMFNDNSPIIQRLNLIIFGLEITPVIPYIIFILKKVVDEEEQERMFKLLEIYLMRRAIVGETTKNYNKFFAGLIGDDKANYISLAGAIDSSDDPSSWMPNDQKLTQAFESGTFTNKKAKLVLYFLELHAREPKEFMELRTLKGYQTEHIMPKKWETYWNSNLSAEQAETRNNLILTLGNLTLLTSALNASLKNFAWIDKRDGKGANKGFKDYCAGIKTFFKCLELDNWNEETILERSQKLLALAKDLWPYGRQS